MPSPVLQQLEIKLLTPGSPKPSNDYTTTAEINATSIQFYYSRACNVMAVPVL